MSKRKLKKLRTATRSEQRLRAYLRPGAARWSWWWVYLRNPFNGDLISPAALELQKRSPARSGIT